MQDGSPGTGCRVEGQISGCLFREKRGRTQHLAPMLVHISLLRAINVGGRQPIIMAELRDLLTELGFQDTRSLLQTGNLVFRSKALSGVELEEHLEKAVEQQFNLRTDFLVRTKREWKQIIAHNPFREEAKRDAAHLVVMFLKRSPGAHEVKALQEAITGPEIVSVHEKQAYVVYPAGIGRSRLTNALLEKKLGTRGTGRNWNTVLKLDALASEE